MEYDDIATKEIKKLQKQRDRLLGACRSAVSSLSIFEATKISYFADLAKEYLLAAIAAAEKGE